jgi:smad nuclear-interacting protein 1
MRSLCILGTISPLRYGVRKKGFGGIQSAIPQGDRRRAHVSVSVPFVMPRRSASPPLSRRHRDESPRGARGYDDRGSSRPDERERDRDRRQPDRDDRRRYEDDRRSGRGRRQDDYRAGPRDDRRVDRLDSRRDDRRDNRRDDRHDERHDDRRDDRRGPDAERPRSRSPVPAQAEDPNKGKPNFKPSGLLAAETKTVASADGTKTVLKYHEPPEARKPLVGWRLYVFKGTEQVGECLSI